MSHQLTAMHVTGDNTARQTLRGHHSQFTRGYLALVSLLGLVVGASTGTIVASVLGWW